MRLSRLFIRLGWVPAALACALGLPSSAAAANPCQDPARAPQLRCPDLVMDRPFDLYLRRTAGRTYLHSASALVNRGRGPLEVSGTRISPRTMRVRQVIHGTAGRRSFATPARISFKTVPRFGPFWKFRNAAVFELWTLDAAGQRARRIRVGGKLIYCLRDYSRWWGFLPGSPRRRIFPACSQNPRRRTVTLGTSVGWADVYPASYPEQYVEVTGLRGRFELVHVADPGNDLFERDETNNDMGVTVSLGGSASGPLPPSSYR
jgi:hypothetical protein